MRATHTSNGHNTKRQPHPMAALHNIPETKRLESVINPLKWWLLQPQVTKQDLWVEGMCVMHSLF